MIDFLNSLPRMPARLDFVEWAMVTGGLLWQWIGGHLLGYSGGGGWM